MATNLNKILDASSDEQSPIIGRSMRHLDRAEKLGKSVFQVVRPV
jgi:hypothetical protein